MNVADQIHEYAYTHYILPARDAKRKNVTITAGEVHRALELSTQVSRVCNALMARLKPSIKFVSFPIAAQYKVPNQLLHSRFDSGFS